jgi:transposase
LKGKINNLLAMQGIELKREALSSKIALERVLALPVSGMVKLELRVLVEQIRSLSESIAELDEQLEEEGRQLPGYENLTSIKGIGSLSATVLLTVIGKISDFADENKLAAYLGLVPRIANSNESERSGRITKQGNKLARTALVQCGLVAKRYSPYLQSFYERIKNRRGGGKAKIALARKLVKIVYDTLKNQWVFEDFPSFTLAGLKPAKTTFE